MADSPFGDQRSTPEPGAPPTSGGDDGFDVELDVSAFLPEGVELAVGADGPVLVDTTELAADESGDESGEETVGETGGELGDEVVEEAGDGLEVDDGPAPGLDAAALDQLERDLDGVDAAIERLDAGTYGIDPATGEPIDDALLAEDPTRLR